MCDWCQKELFQLFWRFVWSWAMFSYICSNMLVEHCTSFTSICGRYSEDSLCVVTRDSMTIREIGEISCSVMIILTEDLPISFAGSLIIRECITSQRPQNCFVNFLLICNFVNINCKNISCLDMLLTILWLRLACKCVCSYFSYSLYLNYFAA